MADAAKRNLKIKTGVLQRIAKELEMYHQEEESVKARLEELKAANEDYYVVKKQEEVIGETQMMIPETKRRLEAAHQDLSDLVSAEEGLADTAEYAAAVDALQRYRGAAGLCAKPAQ